MRLEILKRVKHAILHSTSLGNGARRLGTRRDFWGTPGEGGVKGPQSALKVAARGDPAWLVLPSPASLAANRQQHSARKVRTASAPGRRGSSGPPYSPRRSRRTQPSAGLSLCLFDTGRLYLSLKSKRFPVIFYHRHRGEHMQHNPTPQ
jgi:hypothetical protein